MSGEESAAQVRLRAERLGPDALVGPGAGRDRRSSRCSTRSSAERPEVCVVDSVQTLYSEDLTGAPGSVGQVREVAARLERFAREHGCAVVLVGHVTKDGTLAGPRVLEHAVDCVLQFEGERAAHLPHPARAQEPLRLDQRDRRVRDALRRPDRGGRPLRALPRARRGPWPGSCVLCAMEGTRPLLVEVQALVAPSDVVPPRRIANGIDRNRLSLVLATLARHGGPSAGLARTCS